MRWLVFAWLALSPLAALAEEGTLVLNEQGYWRRYYQFGMNRLSPAALKAGGNKFLQGRIANRVKADTEKALRAKGMDPAKVDWRDHAVLGMGGGGFRTNDPVPTPQPPDDWMQPDFDDGAWVRERRPFQGGPTPGVTTINLGQYDESVDLRLLAACYRARFVLAEPEAVALRLAYSGGARVFVNGREVARGHLPKGALAPDTPAEDYPAEAYGPKGAELCQRLVGLIAVPAAALRKGVNVLAVEIRASRFHPVVLTNPIQPNWGGPQRPWPHGRLISLQLRSGPKALRPASERPAGVQVWVEDMHHRAQSTDFLPPGEAPGTVKFVAARNGTYSAQVVIHTESPLADIRARASDLAGEGGGKLPASAIRVSHLAPYPVAEWSLKKLGDERGLGASFPDAARLAAWAKMEGRGAYLFDQLIPAASVALPADAARPIWLSLRVPADATPGTYRGSVEVTAKGMEPASLPVEAEILAWRLPDPKDFQTLVGCEENPYGVAKQYGVKLWSDEHFKLLEASFRQLARIGNAWLNVPVIARTEFGNRFDSMIRWTRRGGRVALDYALLDRYLDLAIKHCGTPRVVQFVVMQGMKSQINPNAPAQVSVLDEATGKAALAPVDRAAWEAFARSVVAHMKARGLDKCMYWGAPLEGEADPQLKTILAAAAPSVFWAACAHEIMYNAKYALNDRFYRLITDIRYQGGWRNFRDDQGWRSKTIHLANPRVGGTSFALHTTSHPFAYRVMVDRALAMGRNGFSWVGADEWAASHYEGLEVPRYLTGTPVLFLLWPGEAGAQSSARFEALLEGIQETEARIAIEQAIERGRVPAPLAARLRKALADHFDATTFFLGNSIIYSMEQYHHGWQARSRRLYRAAAAAAAAQAQ
ncbi:MAG TPA: glycoside hydrolase domain-containing protein [Planctomycetota bacterium]|nr:glycoside hydrolase domain-containing protein [Planctomycetota bacterium]